MDINYAEAVAAVVRTYMPGADDRIVTRAVRAMPDTFTHASTPAEVLAYLVAINSDFDTIAGFRADFPGMITDEAEPWALRALIWGRNHDAGPSQMLRERHLVRLYEGVRRYGLEQASPR
jgi:hypothetical protein